MSHPRSSSQLNGALEFIPLDLDPLTNNAIGTLMTPSNSMVAIKRGTVGLANISPYQQVRQVALKLFAENGFQNVTLRKLAGTLGVQPGSLYNHIESKLDLLFELIDEHETDLLDSIKASVPKSGTPQEKLSTYIQSHIDFNAHHLHGLSLTQLEFRSLNPRQQYAINTARMELENILVNIIKQGTQQNIFKPIPLKSGAAFILAMLNEAARIQHTYIKVPQRGSTLLLEKMIFAALENP